MNHEVYFCTQSTVSLNKVTVHVPGNTCVKYSGPGQLHFLILLNPESGPLLLRGTMTAPEWGFYCTWHPDIKWRQDPVWQHLELKMIWLRSEKTLREIIGALALELGHNCACRTPIAIYTSGAFEIYKCQLLHICSLEITISAYFHSR